MEQPVHTISVSTVVTLDHHKIEPCPTICLARKPCQLSLGDVAPLTRNEPAALRRI
jgi:hypothetical protein